MSEKSNPVPSVEDAFARAMEPEDVRGRSLWTDAWHRLLKNRAAVVSGVIMLVMLLAVLFGPMLAPWEGDFTDWDHTSSPPSLETGHWFGTDAVGRDILVRTLEGGRISLLVGFVATLVSLAKGYSAVRLSTLQTLIKMLNRDIYPAINQKGSVGTSGDLSPLSQMAEVVMGEGRAFYKGKVIPVSLLKISSMLPTPSTPRYLSWES